MTRGSKQSRDGEGAAREVASPADPRPGRPLLEPAEAPAAPRALTWVAGLAAAAATFALDLATPDGVAASALYVAAVLILLASGQRWAVVAIALLCTGLTVAGALLGAAEPPLGQVAADGALALVAIWSVALFGSVAGGRAQVPEERGSRFLGELGRRLVGRGESEQALAEALRATVEHFGAGYGALAEADAEAAAVEVALDLPAPAALPWPALGETGRSRLADGLPILVADLRADPVTAGRYEESFEPLRWRSLAILPLGADSALWLAGSRPHAWDDDRDDDRDEPDGGVLRSAADLLALAAECGRTRVELRHAQRSRDEYLAMLAHELRGPMAPMRTDLSILAGRIDPLSEAERLRGRVERQLVQLARLTDGLLDVARLTQGKVRLEPRPVDLRRVVETAVESCRPALAERRQELVVRLPERPVTVDGDAARLEQVVANLLANASKYSPEGSHAWVALTVQDGEAAIAVRDDGAGLAADFLPYAFEPFSQGQRGADRAAGGLGLGLALVRRVTELHGGRVEATSDGVGHGSTFTVRLPLHRHDAAADNGVDPAGDGAAAARRVLVVDDNRDARESLAEWLRMQGHEVVTAAHAQEALERAREARPEIGLLDIGLPGLDGYQLAGLLRGELDGIKLVATSGYGQPEAIERSRRAGFDLHLVKPLDLRSLADAIDRR